MSNPVRDRLIELFPDHEARGFKAGLARLCGVKPASVSGWFSGDSLSMELVNAEAICARHRPDINPRWLADGTGSKAINGAVSRPVDVHVAGDAPSPGQVEIHVSDAVFSAGNGAKYVEDKSSSPVIFQEDFFRDLRIKPENCRRFKVTGDSMEPLLFAGDWILVDMADNDPAQIVDGKVYAIRYGDDLKVKRLYRQLDGTVVLRSYNPEFADESVPASTPPHLFAIIGRVRDKSGRGGL